MLTLNDEATTNTTVAGTTIALDTPAAARWPAATAPVILAIAHVPLLVFYAWWTWEKPHYRFLPLVPIGAGWLAFRAARMLGAIEPGGFRVARAMLWGCWALLGAACLLVSPWLGAVAALAQVGAIAYALGGTRLVRAILPAWAFLGLVITPPLTPNYRLVAALQWGVTRFSCRILDLIGVYHLRDGNVIRLAHRTLLVEEACSGIHSLYAVLAGTIFFAASARRSFLRGVVLVVSAVLWVTAGNALRIVAVAALAARCGIDAATGWPHEALGLAIFAAALGLAASTDAWFALAADEWALAQSRRPSRKKRVKAPSAVAAAPEPSAVAASRNTQHAPRATSPEPEPAPIRLPALGRTKLNSRPLAFAYAALILSQVGLLRGRAADYLIPDSLMAARFEGLAALKDDTLPESWGPLGGRASSAKDGPSAATGLYSRGWSYRWGGRTATVVVDGPWRGWHDLPFCYASEGWSVTRRVTRPADGPGGAAVEVRLDRPPEQQGDLFFGLTDEHGRPLAPPLEEGWATLLPIQRLEDLPDRLGLVPSPRSYQIQLLVTGGNSLSDTERAQALAFFRAARRLIQQAAPGGKEGNR